jgi:murein L,D-transpeptidase YcbB/YkuD
MFMSGRLAIAAAGVALLALPVVAAPASAETFGEYKTNCLRHGQQLSTNGLYEIPTEQLVEGDTGDCVAYLQDLLDTKGWGFNGGFPYSLDIDGQFGPKTNAAVLSFQRGEGLQVDGEVGPYTWTALGAFRD